METEATIQGVSLARYAAVKAATAEGFALADVLAVEGLGASAWKEADTGWKLKLTSEPAVASSYQGELAAAEDWLFRRVAPLEDNPEAWVAFLHAFTQSTEPFALLEANQLGLNDISRLARRWALRIEQEPALEKKLAKLSQAPGTLPRVEVEPAKLRSSPLAEAVPSAIREDESPSSSVTGRRALEAHHAVLHALAAKGAQAESEVLPWVPATVNVPLDPLPLAMRGFVDVRGTQLAPEAPPAGPALPFDPKATPQLPEPSEVQARIPEGMRGLVDLGGTQAAPGTVISLSDIDLCAYHPS